MATDRKADHVGNHGGAYTDLDGMRKQFTYIDHDKKPQTMGTPDAPEEGWQSKYKANLIERITSISASICPEIFTDFTVRGEGKTKIDWNMDMLIDSGVPIIRLRDMAVILENKVERKITF